MQSVRKIGLIIGLLVFIVGASSLYDIAFPLMFAGVIIFLISLEKVHKEGYRLFIISMLISFGTEFIFQPLSIFLYIFSLFVLWFFRDPERNTPLDNNAVISPADGTICKIDQAPMPKETSLGNEACLRVCIFMNVVNVHVNRAPISGIIDDTSEALWTALQSLYMSRPSTPSEWKDVSKGFQEIWNFPHCVGV